MKRTESIRAPGAPGGEGGPSVCPHCWMVNPAPFTLCARCGADMRTWLQESGGLRRTAPVQSPVPVGAGARLSGVQRFVVGLFVVILAMGYVAHLLPALPGVGAPQPREVSPTP